MIPDEAVVLVTVRKWYAEKPDQNRILSRSVLETRLTGSAKWDRISRMRLTRMVNTMFPTYSVNRKTRAWIITPEVLA